MRDKSTPAGLRLLRIREVCARVGLHRATIYRAAASGEFPQPIAIGKRSTAWLENEIDSWIRERIRERDSATA